MSKELTPLQALNKISEKWIVCWNNGLGHSNQIKELDEYKTIETALKKYEVLQEVHKDFVDKNIKKLKALDIIKEKRVDTYFLVQTDALEEYNNSLHICSWFPSYELTQEEYDLLKEVLL